MERATIAFMKSQPGVKRGCGLRTQGGVYLESAASPFGIPIEHYIIDTPHPFKTDSNVGTQIWQDPRTGVYHVVDHVGASHYPEAADFIEEGVRYGFSRKVTPNMQWEKLTGESRMLLIHPRGYLSNSEDFTAGIWTDLHLRLCGKYQRSLKRSDKNQLQKPDEHINKPSLPCNAYWYIAVGANVVYTFKDRKRTKVLEFDKTVYPEKVQYHTPVGTTGVSYFRRVGSIEYQVYPHKELYREDGVIPVWESALIASLPITNISVIKANDDSHKSTFAKVRGRCNMQMNVSISEA